MKYKKILLLWLVQQYSQIFVLVIKLQSKNPFERMALSSFDTKIMKVVQATNHQGDVRYGMSRVYGAHVCHLCQFVGH